MTTINDLPIELLPFIFRSLGIVDLKSARLVCKKWRHYCDKEKVMELIIKHPDQPVCSKRWYHTKKPIEEDNVILMKMCYKIHHFSLEDGTSFNALEHKHILKELPQIYLLRELKRLMISCRLYISTLLLNNLNQYPKLVQLVCDFYISANHLSVFTISHPNIQILSIKSFTPYKRNRLRIDMEKLEVLEIETLNPSTHFRSIELTCPELIFKLHFGISEYDDNYDGDQISQFKNLEFIHSGSCDFEPMILAHLPKLRVFKFIGLHKNIEYTRDLRVQYIVAHRFPIFKRSVSNLMRVKEELKRKDLKIYYENTELATEYALEKVLKEIRQEFAYDSDGNEYEFWLDVY